MDDPLRPKPVPLSDETVLWFEFLLNPQLITHHLELSNPEPNAIELLTQFISMVPDSVVPPQYEVTTPDVDNIPATPGANLAVNTPSPLNIVGAAAAAGVEGLKIPRKQLALKILALKTATFLQWNLDLFEKNLPISKQLFLLRDLCAVSFGKLISIPLLPDFQAKIAPEGNDKAAQFALTFYHRWVLRLQILKEIAIKTARPTMGNMFVPMEPMHQFFAPDIAPQPSIDYLLNICRSSESFFVFTYNTFITLHPNSDKTQQNFDTMKEISNAELRTQIYFDLVNFYLHTKQYELARNAVNECRKNLIEMKAEYLKKKLPTNSYIYCHMNEEELEGYLLACGLSNQTSTLTHRFDVSVLSQYKDILDILQLDNQVREIPFVNRRYLELDIEAGISHGILKESRTLEMHVAALNIVRSIFDSGNIFASVDYFEKYRNLNCSQILVNYFVDVLPVCNENQLLTIKNFLSDCVIKQGNGKELLQHLQFATIFGRKELDELTTFIAEEEHALPTLVATLDWKTTSKLSKVEIGLLERQLISCSNANAVRKYLVKLAATNPQKPLWTVNPSWEIATPIKTLLMSMQRGFLQDFAYVLLGKARELTEKHDFIGAVSMLSVLKSETQRQELTSNPIVSKLGKLVNWEILLIQIMQCFEEWNRKTLDLQSLGSRSKQCLSSLQSGDNTIPRIEIVEMCVFMLLNLSDWNAIVVLDKRLPQLELPIAFAATFIDMEKMKGPKKVNRDIWEIVLSMFLSKRSIAGSSSGQGGSSRNSPNLVISNVLQPFLKRIRHQMLFSLTISLLGKIYSILKDDSNNELSGEYMQLWPTSITNQLSYSIRSVGETLNWLLVEALKYYPHTIAWLKMKGDLELSLSNNESAIHCYVNALITSTDYCTIALQRNIADDFVIRKMIRCTSNLGCHMQATILCQFLEDIDYALVFKNLTEKSSNFTDAMDAYYSCIWDNTLFEFIVNLHAKKGEYSRKQEAIAIMSTLELNANNNEEIKREAAAIRKQRFIRALAKQYLS